MELEKNNDQQIEACTLTAEEIIAEELAKEALEETVQNTDTTDGDLKNDLETVPLSKKKKSLRGLVLANLFLIMGICVILIFWILRYKDVFL